MKGYRVCFEEPRKAVLEEFNVRTPKDDEVVVKVMKTLISAGTEKAYLSALPNTAQKFPAVPGYSSAGVVVECGKKVTEFVPGDKVFVSYGGHASYNIKSKKSVVKIPEGVGFEAAAFTRVASFPLLALRRSRLELGESVAVIGLGMLGLFGVQLAKIMGGVPIIAVGNREVRREKAKEFGAELVLDPMDKDLIEKIMAFTNNKGTNVTLETSGNIDALIEGLKYTGKWGRVLVNGCNRITEKPIDLYKYIHVRAISLIGAHDGSHYPYNSAPGNWTAKRDYETLLNLMLRGRLNTKSMISEIISPEQTTEIYSRLVNDREFPLGVLFDWEKF